jgi:hypothetical protein
MKKLNIKEILKDNLRQIEKELKYYAETQNQEMFFEVFNDKLAIQKRLNKQ